MTKGLISLFALAFVAVSCSHGVSRIRTRSLTSPNPTSYLFPLPLEEVHTNAWRAFSIEQQHAQPIFGDSRGVEYFFGGSGVGVYLEPTFSAECASNAVFGEAVFRDPANAQDIYLHTFHAPFVISSVYSGRFGGLPFIATFHLHLTGSSSNTTVTVTASDTQVINGTRFGFGPCGAGQGYNYHRVRPTTVEEYFVLRYLGSYLGVTSMPEVILPRP